MAAGAAALAALWLRRDDFFGRHISSYAVQVGDLVPVVLLGVGAATVAALIPARSASRIPVLAALAGRRPLGAVNRSLTATGLVSCAVGLGLLALAIVGSTAPDDGSSQASSAVWGLGQGPSSIAFGWATAW